jgi:hypothetical protein
MSENVAMNPERFAALADAFGAQIGRWPDAERAAAAVFAETAQGKEILSRADQLDALLDAHTVPPPSANLRAQVLRQATEKFKKKHVMRWRVGLAGVGFAGVIAGMIMATLLDFSLKHNSAGVETTAFGDVASDSMSFQEED